MQKPFFRFCQGVEDPKMITLIGFQGHLAKSALLADIFWDDRSCFDVVVDELL